jgi:hypothetical protein
MTFNPLNPIWEAYQTSQGCFKIAEKVVKQADKEKWLLKTLLAQTTATQAQNLIRHSKTESGDLFVLAVWATFERFLRDYLQTKGEKLREIYPPALASSFYQQLYRELEYWRPDDMLDLLKSILPSSNLIGQARQILEYRDWIAHGKNPETAPSANITPTFAYEILSEVVHFMLLN